MGAVDANGGVIVAQLGARMHYAVPRMLEREGVLAHFYTDICAAGWPRLVRHLPSSLCPPALRRLIGRTVPDVPPERLTSFVGFGLKHAAERLSARTATAQTMTAIRGGRHFAQLVARRGVAGAAGVFGYNGECRERLLAAKRAGLWTAMEQTIAPRRLEERLLAHERRAFPGWAGAISDAQAARLFAEREESEWWAADVVLCGSEFVRDGLVAAGYPAERCRVVPYGVDARFQLPPRPAHDGPLRVLTVGAVGLRKGSPYVVAAARALAGIAQFRMVGPCELPAQVRADVAGHVDLAGIIPRAEMRAQFEWADIFLLPSLCEGSATAIYEALAAGLPVICTPNAGSVVRHGVDGFVVPIRDVEAIVHGIACLAENAEKRREMAFNAARRAADFTLDAYRRRFLDALPFARAAEALGQAS